MSRAEGIYSQLVRKCFLCTPSLFTHIITISDGRVHLGKVEEHFRSLDDIADKMHDVLKLPCPISMAIVPAVGSISTLGDYFYYLMLLFLSMHVYLLLSLY
jgi:hypothetical protein